MHANLVWQGGEGGEVRIQWDNKFDRIVLTYTEICH